MRCLWFIFLGLFFGLSFPALASHPPLACGYITQDGSVALSPRPPMERFQTYEDILRRFSQPTLNLDTYSALIQHPIFQLPRLLRRQGISLQFDIQRGIADSFLHFHSSFKGEQIQGRFIKEILRALFPNAPIFSRSEMEESMADSPHYQTVYIWIEDFAEHTHSSVVDEDAWLDLNLLKAGNPGLIQVTHDELRASLGIPTTRPVVSVYLRTGHLINDPHVQRALIELATLKGFQDIFISAGSPINPQRLLQVTNQISLNEKILSLSQVDEHSAQEPRRWIYNDTAGLLPQIHATADLAVAIGVVNFFEPLSVKTPTVFYLPPTTAYNYNFSALLPLIKTAQRTAGFIEVHDPLLLSSAIDQMMSTPRSSISVPAFITPPTSPSPFHQTLSALEDLILKQLENNSQSPL